MRVLHIITRMIVGGAQENTLFNCLDLARHHGDQVRLLTGPSLGSEGELLSRSDVTGVEIETSPSLLRAIHPYHDWRAYQALKRSIQSWRPDVVHTHSAKGGLLGRAAAWQLRVPCVVHTVHGAPFHPYQSVLARKFFIACERWAAKRCHHMISVADAMTDLMVDAKVADRSQFTTIYSGMDVEPFLTSGSCRDDTRKRLGFASEDIVFGKIARLFHLKGHQYVIEAARRIGDQLPHAKFLFVGDGLLRAQLESQIEAAGLRDRFVFTGLVSPAEIPALISAMDVLVHASLREGLARALPQALLSGKPVISFNIDGAREVVLSGITGYLTAPKDINQLADAMRALGLSPSDRKAFGEEGRMRFTEQFRHESMTRSIRELYQRVLAGATGITRRG
ncbi:2-deoxystreptamine glucosyltransferase [Pirellula sp. SH-Sr6A]|uniref:glycosyltransferase family 4 protein n=1 Tax=Pirellula sp. SH-Sr6A TaxID=1632865 RepID=UPI00078D6B1A|nr:glycosyltransferase family 4 protein [Pirellula sp. SH-Sr6A]AMV33666.1 2-deoxystreptamine glucosyltransferase [Pirellula sp. SH-Sr6A]